MKKIVNVWIEDFFGESNLIGHDSSGVKYAFVTNIDKRSLPIYELAVSTFKNGNELFGISTDVFHGGQQDIWSDVGEFIPVTRAIDGLLHLG